MSEEHLSRTIELLLGRCKKINLAKNANPRYISDIEELFDRLSKYFFVAEMIGVLKRSHRLELINEYEEYHRERTSVLIPE